MKRKLIIIAIIGILLLTGSSSLLATGKNVKTEGCIKQTTDDISSLNFGNTIYVGGNGPDNYSAIQDAVDSANPGDTVYVYDDSAPYYENIIVDKTLNLIGENNNTTIIDGMMSGAAIYISAEKVNISGFSIINSPSAGIDIHSKYTNISGNNIFENIICGIICHSNENMIYKNNIISNMVYGIFFAEGSSYNTVLNNNISFNHNGIESSGYNTFSDNIITFNEGRGISLCIYGDNTISGNLLSNNLFGMYVDVGDNLVYNNNFLNNERGVFIRSSENNMFYHNNFIGNTDGNAEEFYCINTIWDDGEAMGNYWDDYHGWDLNPRDGIGDIPYNIPDQDGQRNSDRYPLMGPYPDAYSNNQNSQPSSQPSNPNGQPNSQGQSTPQGSPTNN